MKRKQQNGRNKDVPCPKPVVEYNKFMGGVDLSDKLRVEFRTARNAKRWWTYVFYFLFDLCISNALILMKELKCRQRMCEDTYRASSNGSERSITSTYPAI